jgi:signal transduction histidine kinase
MMRAGLMGVIASVPMRWKILVVLLAVVTAAVGIITFTMAGMFHADKKAYVSDMVSVIAVHGAEEASAVLTGYRDRMLAFAEVVNDPQLAPARKSELMRELFPGMKGFVGLRIFEGVAEVGSLYDRDALVAAGVDPRRFASKLKEAQPGPPTLGPSGVRVTNSTVSDRMPTMSMSVASRRAGSTLVLTGILNLDQVLAVGRSSQAFEVFLADAQGNVLVHGDRRHVVTRARFDWIPPIPRGSLAVVREYTRNDVNMIGGFALVGFGDLRLGAQIPRAAAYFASRRLLLNLVLVALALLLGAAVVGHAWSHHITRSIARLADAAGVIAQGEFGVQVRVPGRDEMGRLADSFNRMSCELARRERELRQAHAQLIHSEKMAAFGQLGAGFAHEVKNPLAGIQGLAQLTLRGLDPSHPLAEPLATVEKEARRCRDIIDKLLKFSRQERFAPEPISVQALVEDAAGIMRHQMALHDVRLHTRIEPGLPPLLGSSNQLQQVLMNLLLNAQQAMERRGGAVVVSVGRSGANEIEIQVQDDGPGIPQEIRARVFEPFFTTKPTGQGTGLGLSVSFGIVREHGGSIAVESEPGRGTTFVLRLPAAVGPTAAGGPPPREGDRAA